MNGLLIVAQFKLHDAFFTVAGVSLEIWVTSISIASLEVSHQANDNRTAAVARHPGDIWDYSLIRDFFTQLVSSHFRRGEAFWQHVGASVAIAIAVAVAVPQDDVSIPGVAIAIAASFLIVPTTRSGEGKSQHQMNP